MTDTRPRSQPETENEAWAARQAIAQYWVEHVPHLSPEGNKLGSGAIVEKLGVVCNCGDVLGFPPDPQDPEEYLAEADAALASPNVPDDVAVAADATLRGHEPPEDLAQEQQDGPPWDTTDGTGPTKLETTGGGKDHDLPEGWQDAARAGFNANPAAQSYAQRYAEMEDRLRRNPNDVEARAFVHGGMDSTGDPVGDDPADEHGARTETVVDLPPMPGDLPDPPGGPRGQLPARRMDSGVVPEDPISERIVVIDPSRPYTPVDVEHQLLDVEARLEKGVHFQRMWEERNAAAEARWEIIYNRARRKHIGNGGSEKERHALAMGEPEVEEAFLERHFSAAMVKHTRETMHNLRSLQSGYQTISRSVENSYRGRQPGA